MAAQRVRCEDVSGDSRSAIAVCFYGLIRNIGHTLAALQMNLLAPLRKVGPSDVFIHSLIAERSGSTRYPTAGEADVTINPLDYEALQPCRFQVEDQDEVDADLNISERSAASFRMSSDISVADAIGTNGSLPNISVDELSEAKKKVRLSRYTVESYANVMRAKYSMWRATRLVLVHEAERRFKYMHIVVARPDTAITSPLQWQPFDSAHPEWLRVPSFAHNFGLNDRFAYGTRNAMLTFTHMQHEQLQRTKLLVFPTAGGVGGSLAIVNSETWLCSLVARHSLVVGLTRLCIVRMRANGSPNPRDVNRRASVRELPRSCERTAGLMLHLNADDLAKRHEKSCLWQPN